MPVNKFKIVPDGTNKNLNVKLYSEWDLEDRDDAIDEYKNTVVEEVVGKPVDYEIGRFEFKFGNIEYKFYFNNKNLKNATFAGNSYTAYPNYVDINDQPTSVFTVPEIYYQGTAFKNSFFKLDFYDSSDPGTQTIQFTIIIPTHQGEVQTVTYEYRNYIIKRPWFKLNKLTDKEGYYLYWLKKKNLFNIDTFYMSAKFFDAKTGKFLTFLTSKQSSLGGSTPNKFTFTNNLNKFSYYKVKLDYNDFTYLVGGLYETFTNIPSSSTTDGVITYNNTNTNLFGTSNNPVVWYEYLD